MSKGRKIDDIFFSIAKEKWQKYKSEYKVSFIIPHSSFSQKTMLNDNKNKFSIDLKGDNNMMENFQKIIAIMGNFLPIFCQYFTNFSWIST